MTAEGRLAALQPTDRVLVTGAAGWLGRELIAWLHEHHPLTPVLAVGSRASVVDLDSTFSYDCLPWSDVDVASWQPTIAVHLAFLTKERTEHFSETEYSETNHRLSQAALALYDEASLRAVVVASAGAAVQQQEHPYGRLKAEDEKAFAAAGGLRGIPTVVARAWSLSGRLCTKPERFLLYDLIGQTLDARPSISIQADHEVWRKYVDAGEYLAICLGAAAANWSGVIDSTGTLVEAGGLAKAIQEVLGVTKPIERPALTAAPDRYCSDSPALEDWSARLGLRISPLNEQIARSARQTWES